MAKSKRRALDFYETAPWQVDCLMTYVHLSGLVFEPCAGAGAISGHLSTLYKLTVITADVDTSRSVNLPGADAQDPQTYQKVGSTGHPDWVVSNPPYKMPDCLDIVALAVSQARVGVAMNLRLSFLEPTHARGPWLAEHPPTQIIVMPRYSYTGNGKSDSMTTAWMVWQKKPYPLVTPIICAYDANK